MCPCVCVCVCVCVGVCVCVCVCSGGGWLQEPRHSQRGSAETLVESVQQAALKHYGPSRHQELLEIRLLGPGHRESHWWVWDGALGDSDVSGPWAALGLRKCTWWGMGASLLLLVAASAVQAPASQASSLQSLSLSPSPWRQSRSPPYAPSAPRFL